MTCQRGTSSTKTVPDGTSSTKTVQDGTYSTKRDWELHEGTYSTKTDEDQAPKVIKGRKMESILTGKSVLETGVLDAARGAELIRGRNI